ncbi:FtsW/RodA/SpoVE family cell cycle protein [Niallia sp. Krafla_26]|uniref:FtsW/RodA/SpoVE family cell cycle protein n=1 Tax=Niallia sp. Krafla_26 TaxID=3064703 RepID=UPI003D1640A6
MGKDKDTFLSEVLNQIRSKEAKKFVSSELEYHLKRSKNRWMEKGFNEFDAEEKAVKQLGNPIQIGHELNKLHRTRIDWFMVILLGVTLALSFLPIFALGYANDGPFLMNKIVFVILGAATVMGMMLIDYRKLEKLGWLFYTIGVMILFMLIFIPNIFINGQPFIQIGPLMIDSFMAVPFFFIAWTSFFNKAALKIWHFGLLFIFSLYLFLWIPSLSTTFIYMIMVFIMLWWSKIGRKKALMMTVVTICMAVIVGLLFRTSIKEYQLARILGFLNPENDENGAGYIYLRLKEIISEAGWFGISGNKEFIPSAHTDLVFASLIHSYGYGFAILLFLILSFIVIRMVVISYKVNDHYGKLLLVGGITLFGVQFIYNIGMVLGLLPITSISLPFISYGLMPTLFNAFIIGSVLSVYRRKDLISSRFS